MNGDDDQTSLIKPFHFRNGMTLKYLNSPNSLNGPILQITDNRLTIETLMDQVNQTSPAAKSGWQALMIYGRMVKFSHSIFALPFALAAVILAQRQAPLKWLDLVWILIAMVSARSAAMGFNRIVDARFDEQNPRTQNREIPAGQIPMSAAGVFVFFPRCIFLLMAWLLGKVCFYSAFPVLAILLAYSYTKRFTWGSHLILGLAIALAPMGAWMAVTKSFDGAILWLSLALLTHIAGFDILYACQDYEFDRSSGSTLYSDLFWHQAGAGYRGHHPCHLFYRLCHGGICISPKVALPCERHSLLGAC